MSKNSIIQKIEQEQLKTNVPSFSPGDTIVVQVRIKEGDRERLQAFEGVVIGKRNRGLNSAFTVRKMSHGVGVERTFQTHSNQVESITVKRRGDVRQAKLYYLRDLTGRAARIAEKLGKKGEQDTETPLDDTTSIAEQIEAAQEEDLASGAIEETEAEDAEGAGDAEDAVAEESVADEVATAPAEEAAEEVEVPEVDPGENPEEPVAEVAEEEQAAAEPAPEDEAPAAEQQDEEEEKKD